MNSIDVAAEFDPCSNDLFVVRSNSVKDSGETIDGLVDLLLDVSWIPVSKVPLYGFKIWTVLHNSNQCSQIECHVEGHFSDI